VERENDPTLQEMGLEAGVLRYICRRRHVCVSYEDEAAVVWRKIRVPERQMSVARKAVTEKDWAALEQYEAVDENEQV
jgi:hypothetical protein